MLSAFEKEISLLIWEPIVDELMAIAAINGDLRQMEALKLFREIAQNLPVQDSQADGIDEDPSR